MALAVCKGEGEPEGKALPLALTSLYVWWTIYWGRAEEGQPECTNTTVAVVVGTVLRRYDVHLSLMEMEVTY